MNIPGEKVKITTSCTFYDEGDTGIIMSIGRGNIYNWVYFIKLDKTGKTLRVPTHSVISLNDK